MSTLKIYGIPASRAFRPLWAAHELGLDYENIPIHYADGSSKTAEFLAINPNGRIPAMDDDGLILFESMAITLYLARKHGGGLWPESPEDRARAEQWTFWAVAEIEKPLITVIFNRLMLPEDQRDEAKAVAAIAEVQGPFRVLDGALENSDYLLGEQFTVADLTVAAVMSVAWRCKLDLSAVPNVAAWLPRCLSRPAVSQARPDLVVTA
jgi:glutathione S-transferase